MRIGIDGRAYSWAGIGRYIRNLLEQLAFLPSDHTYIVLLAERDRRRLASQVWLRDPRFSIRVVHGSYYSWHEQTTLLLQLRQLNVDFFHFTHFNVPLFLPTPYLVTIHDITRLIFPGQRHATLFRQLAYEFVFRQAVCSARAVVSVSATTANDLLHLPMRLPAMRRTIYEGVDRSFLATVPPELRGAVRRYFNLRAPYLLCVGVWMHHKNLRRLLEAFALVRHTHRELELVITGTWQIGYVDVAALARASGDAAHIRFVGKVDEAWLPALYAEAACFVFPSLYEGFGLPALEAASCGCPVVASNVGSLPEVLGGAAEYVNPESARDIAEGICRVLDNPARRAQLVAMGRARAAFFSWRRCAERTLEVYNAMS